MWRRGKDIVSRAVRPKVCNDLGIGLDVIPRRRPPITPSSGNRLPADHIGPCSTRRRMRGRRCLLHGEMGTDTRCHLRSGCWDDAALEQQLDGRLAVAEDGRCSGVLTSPRRARQGAPDAHQGSILSCARSPLQRHRAETRPPLRSSWPLPGATGLVRPQCRLLFSRDKITEARKGASSPRKGQNPPDRNNSFSRTNFCP